MGLLMFPAVPIIRNIVDSRHVGVPTFTEIVS